MELQEHYWLIAVIIATNLPLAYQQKSIVQMSTEVSLCAKSSTESTLKTFWTEAGKCPMDPYRLMDLYEGMSNETGKCRLLLIKSLRKSLVDTSVTIFEEALISQTFSGNFEIGRLAKRLYQLDPRIQEAVWERVIHEVYLFMNRMELAEALFVGLPFEAKVTALLHLQRKFEWRVDSDFRFPVRMTYYLYQLKTNDGFNLLPQTRFDKIFNSLPVQLRTLNAYSRDGTAFNLLNIEHWEYLYAPRENGPDDVRRMPLTWTEKNQTDSDGSLIAELSSTDVCFSSRFGKQLKPLYVDEEQGSPFFWIGEGTKDSRWWSIQYHESYLTFLNVQTNQLLCATDLYDENRRYVTLQSTGGGKDDRYCRWVIVSAN